MIVVESLGLLFVHVPQTGGTAIRHFLEDEFGGVHAGAFHGHLGRHLEPRWQGKQFTRVATIRNPVDMTVSAFFKQQSDHGGRYSSGSLGERRATQTMFAQREDVGFDDWFLRYRKRVFVPSWLQQVRGAEYLLRFESLATDLDDMLTRLGVVDPPPLPVANVTSRPSGIDDFYASEAARRRAHHLFSPLMDEFGYEFPASWPDVVPMAAQLEYAMGQRIRRRLLAPGR